MRLSLVPLDLERHLDLLHRWVTHPRSRFWGMTGWTPQQVAQAYAEIEAAPHHHAWLGLDRGAPAFLAETYDPHVELPQIGARLPRATGDLGMHLLVAPPAGEPETGFTSLVLARVLEHCFADPSVQRVVVEPDVRNHAIRAKNVAHGFRELGEVELADKTAMLSVCSREDWLAAAQVDHLTPARMERAQRHLVAKALSEYAHERLVTPVPDGEGWRVVAGASTYRFTARVRSLEHWVVDAGSLGRTVDGAPAPLDAQALVDELAPVLGIPEDLVPVYLEEIASTLGSTAWKLAHPRATTPELVDAMVAGEPAEAYQLVEAAMTEGHPAFVANNGRIGYGIDDYLAYAPETGADVRLEWVAARADVSDLALGQGQARESFYDEQLGEETHARLRRRLGALGLDPDGYVLLPVHPWQWRNKLAITFAPDVARRDLVHLGAGDDAFRAQQSLRTFFDTTHPERHYVKTALSIQNMGFVRGLSPAYMAVTPAVNDWVAEQVRSDPALQELGFDVLREVAAAGYTGDAFHRRTATSAYQKMVAALWRESPLPRLGAGERIATMASLLHRDAAGDAVVSGLIKASGHNAAGWVRAYLRAYLAPLVHCLWAHDLVFMPHGENVVLRLREGMPVGAFVKDIGEEVAVLAPASQRPLPAAVERIRTDCAEDVKALAIHTDVMDGVLRYVAAILAEDGLLPDDRFWALAREVLEEHAAAHPELREAVARYDLCRPEFRHSCLNRLQLRNTRQMVDITDQAESLIFAGTLRNPLHRSAIAHRGSEPDHRTPRHEEGS